MNGVEFLTSWFTPPVLFCVLNLMIGTLFITSNLSPQKNHSNPRDDNDNEHDHHPQLVRVPSLFERVKSFNLSRYRSDQSDPTHEPEPEPEPEPDPEPEPETEHSHVTRSKPDKVTEVVKNTKKPAARVLKKCFSEKLTAMVQMKQWEDVKESNEQRRPATVRDKTSSSGAGGEDDDEAVDAKADDFINRFRQQLKLQRMDSILRYKEILSRGMGN